MEALRPEYDGNGRILSANNAAISYTFSYDAAGRITQSTDSRGYTVRYKYDLAGNRTNLTYPDGGSVSYSYNAANRLSGMTDWNGRNATFSYDNAGRRIGLSLPNGTKASYGYDQAGRLTDLAHKTGGGSTIDSFSYIYDQIGNRLSVTRPDEKINYAYDLLDRLIQATPTKLKGKDKEQEHKAEEFSYDPVGNRLTGPETKDTYTYDVGNQLVSDRKNQYEYDRNGNLIKKTEIDDDGEEKSWTYSYDFENRLIRVIKQEEDEIETITFKYDPFGRRIEKKITETPSPLAGEGGGEGEAKTYSYVYDNEDIIVEYLVKAEDGKTKTKTTRYLHGTGIDEPLAIEREKETFYYHADGLGSITTLTDARQKEVESYDYTSFGDLKRHGDKVKNTYTFTGREWDSEIDLYYYRARYYDEEVGRFISKDPLISGFTDNNAGAPSRKCVLKSPIGIALEQSQELNPYVYSVNNPIIKTDPFGLSVATINCPATDIVKIQSATAAANTASQTCLPCEDRDSFSKKIEGLIINCTSTNISPSGSTVCGYTYGGNTIYLTPFGIAGVPGCGCPEATILHEVTHTIGYNESQARKSERDCFSCAQ